MPLTVYCDPCTINSRKVLAGLSLLDTKYEFKKVDYFKSEQKADWFTKINPFATVPAAVEDDLHLTESNAILQYAADKSHTAYPSDLKCRSKINCWLLWETSAWFPSCYVSLVEHVVKPLSGDKADRSAIDKEAPRWNQLATILNDTLADSKYLTGNDVTIADIAVASPMHLHEAQQLPLDKYPNLARWIKDIEALPCWKETQGAVESALLPQKSSGTNGNPPASAPPVRATLNYSQETAKLTELYFYEHEVAATAHAPGDSPFEVEITTDGRGQRCWRGQARLQINDFHTRFS